LLNSLTHNMILSFFLRNSSTIRLQRLCCIGFKVKHSSQCSGFENIDLTGLQSLFWPVLFSLEFLLLLGCRVFAAYVSRQTQFSVFWLWERLCCFLFCSCCNRLFLTWGNPGSGSSHRRIVKHRRPCLWSFNKKSLHCIRIFT